LASMSWSGHQIHISLPINRLLDSGVDPAVIPWPEDLLFRDCIQVIVPSFGSGGLVDFSVTCPTLEPEYLRAASAIGGRLLNPSTASHHLGVLAAHHFYLALVLIASGLIAYGVVSSGSKEVLSDFGRERPGPPWRGGKEQGNIGLGRVYDPWPTTLAALGLRAHQYKWSLN
jgi:hypothetical protein